MKLRGRLIFGILLIVGGGLLLLQSLDLLKGTWENVVWAVALLTAGAYFLAQYFTKRNQWWWFIPGIILIGGGLQQLLDIFLEGGALAYGNLIVLVSVGIAFFAIYFSNNLHWWAIIPGGASITMGIVSLANSTDLIPFDSGALFFFGLGLTFFLLFFLPTPAGRLKWAIFPALPLLLVGAFLLFENQEQIWLYAGPTILVLAGLYFLLSAFRKRN